MAIAVRAVELQAERDELIDFLGQHLGAVSHSRRFDWLYLHNPAGIANAWFIEESGTRRIVGAASVFPRVVRVGEEVKRCGQVGDFAINVNYRSLGPALLLQQATFEPVKLGQLAFCYDCPPHDLGMATFRRLGLRENCRMATFVRLVRTDRQLAKYIGEGVLGRSLSFVGNALLAAWNSRKRKVAGLEISPYVGRFGEEFTELDRRAQSGRGIRGRREEQDLNWRYRDNPEQEYHVFVARRRGTLEAYAVVAMSDKDASVIDLFGVPEPVVGVELLEAATDHARRHAAQTVRIVAAERHEDRNVFVSAGFVHRGNAVRVVAYTGPVSPLRGVLDQEASWLFNHVDVLA